MHLLELLDSMRPAAEALEAANRQILSGSDGAEVLAAIRATERHAAHLQHLQQEMASMLIRLAVLDARLVPKGPAPAPVYSPGGQVLVAPGTAVPRPRHLASALTAEEQAEEAGRRR